jgi:hypothetical protein
MKIKEIQDEIVDEFSCLMTGWNVMNHSIRQKPSVDQR